jgi:hypothetical protein
LSATKGDFLRGVFAMFSPARPLLFGSHYLALFCL